MESMRRYLAIMTTGDLKKMVLHRSIDHCKKIHVLENIKKLRNVERLMSSAIHVGEMLS